jgi:hypothetical protein
MSVVSEIAASPSFQPGSSREARPCGSRSAVAFGPLGTENAQARPAGGKAGVAMTQDEWVEGLLEKLKSASTQSWAVAHESFVAMPNTIERVIRQHSAGVDPELLKSHRERAKSHFEGLIQQGDPYAETLRRACSFLSA